LRDRCGGLCSGADGLRARTDTRQGYRQP